MDDADRRARRAQARRARDARYRARYPEKVRAVNRARRAWWRERNPEMVRAHAQQRRARKLGAVDGTLTPGIVEKLMKNARRCYYCHRPLGKDRTLDHVVPLARGGLHSIGNVAVCHLRCNLVKGTRVVTLF